jgi:malate dehydrogenase (oxaloacetate-decarboxylating)
MQVVRHVKPTMLIGLSGQRASFTEPLVREMASHVDRPVIFPLSNPTSITEAAPADLFRWTDGRALVATGSPFPPVEHDGRTYPIGQGNNAFIFPGLGLGAILAGAREITDGMVLDAAEALAAFTAESSPALLYPSIDALREAAIAVAASVMARASADGVSSLPELPKDLVAHVRARAWRPRYMPIKRRR